MSNFIKGADMDRSEFLTILVEDYLFARANYTNTLLGTPYEVTIAQGRLSGACMALGIDFRVEGDKYVFYTNKKEKMICVVPMGEYYDMINHQKEVEEKERTEFKKFLG